MIRAEGIGKTLLTGLPSELGCALDKPKRSPSERKRPGPGLRRKPGDHVDRSADGVGPVKGGTGPAQDFDPFGIAHEQVANQRPGRSLDVGRIAESEAVNQDRGVLGMQAPKAVIQDGSWA